MQENDCKLDTFKIIFTI